MRIQESGRKHRHSDSLGLELTTIVEDLPELGYILKGASPRAAPQNHHIFHLCAGIVSLFLFQGRLTVYDGSSRHGSKYKDKEHESQRVPIRKHLNEALPSQHLWVGNVSSNVTEMTLAEQFSRFGDIESLRLYSSKNYAFVTLNTVEDAMYAKKGLHGTVLGGLAIRIEFVKGDGKFNNQYQVNQDKQALFHVRSPKDDKTMIKEKGLEDGIASQMKDAQANISLNSGSKPTLEKSKGNRSGDPSEVLWIGFPLHLRIDERKLHKLFAPFGGVEKITTFPGRTYAFVRFQNVKSASRAKDALQGKLFDDPRVSISFAKSEVGPVDHSEGSSKVFSSLSIEVENVAIRHTLPESSTGKGEVKMKEFTHPSTEKRDSIISIPDTGKPSSLRNKYIGLNSKMPGSPYSSSRSGIVMNETIFSRGSPKSKLYLSDASNNGWSLNTNLVNTEMSKRDSQQINKVTVHEWSEVQASTTEQKRHRGGSDCSDGEPTSKLGYTEPKRQRLDNNQLIQKEVDNIGLWEANNGMHSLWDSNRTYEDECNNSQLHRGCADVHMAIPPKHEDATIASGSKENHEEVGNRGLLLKMPFPVSNPDQTMVSLDEERLPVAPFYPQSKDIQPPPKELFRWEGTIAKGGTVVCHCRCFPATKEIDVKFPDILNCTARTSLDMLAQYIMQVKSFAVVLFMPQGVTDVKPYQELMAFLADKKRAAVCKLSDEHTLFLVPPSDFIEEFLKVPKSNNILGVVLGQQQFLSEVPQTLSSQAVLSQHDKTLVLDDLKDLSYQQLNPNSTSEHPFFNIPCISEPDKGVGLNKNLIGSLSHGKSIDNRVLFHGPVSDSNRMPYSMQGNLILDSNRMAYKNWGNSPMQQDLYVTDKVNLPQIKMQSHKDISNQTLQSETFISSEELSRPNLSYSQTRVTIDSRNISVCSPFHNQSSMVESIVQPMKTTPTVQPTLSLAQSQQFTYNSQLPPSHNLSYDAHQGPWVASSNYALKPVPPAGNLQLPVPPPPPSLFSVQPTSLPLGRDKQTEQQMLQMVENQGQTESNEGQKKFQATLELAAALLQQLQKQTKL